MKTIKMKIVVSIMAMLTLSMVTLSVVTSLMNYTSTISTLESAMLATAKIASERVEWEITSYVDITKEVGSNVTIASTEATVEEKKSIIDKRAEEYGFRRGNVIGTDGKSIFDGQDFSDRDYVKASLAGKTYVTEPLISKITGELTIIISAPIWENAVPNSNVIGVVYFVPKETMLNDIVQSVKVSPNAGGYILDKNGTTIADITMDTVKDGENIEEMAKTDDTLKVLADMHVDMRNGGSGFGAYTIAGTSKFVAYAPIANTNGWSIGINTLQSDFIADTIKSIYATAALMLIAIVISYILATNVGKKIGKPITICTDRLKKLSEGDLKTEVPVIKSKDETGVLAQATEVIVKGLSAVIGDVQRILKAIAEGDLTVAPQVPYPGEFTEMESALKEVVDDLNITLSQINVAAEQVNSGAEQVSSGAQALSQGATEQASSIEELSATINEISSQISQNAQGSREASDLSMAAGAGVMESNQHMQDMIASMQDISGRSNEIGKIIKTIDDIAFQTNILALNAAVEAARAGSAGKGFAVVADEVRNLAQKSAEAAKTTTDLIEGTVSAVANGTKIADETAKSLQIVVDKASRVNVMISEITESSEQQADGAKQITVGVDQISAVVQTNSATAEESAAASEELSSQSVLLKELVRKFRLKSGAEQMSYDNMRYDVDEQNHSEEKHSDNTKDKY